MFSNKNTNTTKKNKRQNLICRLIYIHLFLAVFKDAIKILFTSVQCAKTFLLSVYPHSSKSFNQYSLSAHSFNAI
jgi:hypothetical protein